MLASQIEVGIDTIGGGAITELFSEAITEILYDIRDVNTDLGKRKITITVELKPYADRSGAAVSISCTKQTGKKDPIVTSLAIEDGGDSGLIAVVKKEEFKQIEFFDSLESAGEK